MSKGKLDSCDYQTKLNHSTIYEPMEVNSFTFA